VILGVVSPYFKSDSGEIWPEGTDLGYPPWRLIFKKSLKGEYPLWANLYQKLQISAIFAVQAHILRVKTVNFGVSVRTLDTLPAVNFVKKIAQGICPLGEIHTKNSKFSRFLAT